MESRAEQRRRNWWGGFTLLGLDPCLRVSWTVFAVVALPVVDEHCTGRVPPNVTSADELPVRPVSGEPRERRDSAEPHHHGARHGGALRRHEALLSLVYKVRQFTHSFERRLWYCRLVARCPFQSTPELLPLQRVAALCALKIVRCSELDAAVKPEQWRAIAAVAEVRSCELWL